MLLERADCGALTGASFPAKARRMVVFRESFGYVGYGFGGCFLACRKEA